MFSMSKASPRRSRTFTHFLGITAAHHGQLLDPNDILHDLRDENLVFRLQLQHGAPLERKRVFLPCAREQVIEDFFAAVLDLSVQVASDLAANAVPNHVSFVFMSIAR